MNFRIVHTCLRAGNITTIIVFKSILIFIINNINNNRFTNFGKMIWFSAFFTNFSFCWAFSIAMWPRTKQNFCTVLLFMYSCIFGLLFWFNFNSLICLFFWVFFCGNEHLHIKHKSNSHLTP